jgi:hypothetical protein
MLVVIYGPSCWAIEESSYTKFRLLDIVVSLMARLSGLPIPLLTDDVLVEAGTN